MENSDLIKQAFLSCKSDLRSEKLNIWAVLKDFAENNNQSIELPLTFPLCGTTNLCPRMLLFLIDRITLNRVISLIKQGNYLISYESAKIIFKVVKIFFTNEKWLFSILLNVCNDQLQSEVWKVGIKNLETERIFTNNKKY